MKPPGKIVIQLALLFFFARTHAQKLIFSNQHIGFNVSINLAFGTHFQRVGVNLNFFYLSNKFQANSEVRAYFNYRNLGPRFIYPELVLSQGFLYAYGRERDFFNPFLNSVSNQTKYSNSISYSYNAYFNKRKTTQQTGIISLGFGKVSVIAENDILARTYYDRFRTGAFLLQYQYRDKVQAALNCTLWTGKMGGIVRDTAGCHWPCYMDTTEGIYTHYSHGLLSAQVKYNLDYSQNIQANAGIDAEQIRNAVQNKLIHDMAFLPRKWVKPKNCHLPMLDDKGLPYRCLPGQKIKKPELYLNMFTNANLFY